VIAQPVDDVAALAIEALRGRHPCEAALLALLRGPAAAKLRRARRAAPLATERRAARRSRQHLAG
jgi:hypothetical protein